MEHQKKRQRKARAKKENTLTTRERSKIHRERKKKYYVELESKVKNLEEENAKLKLKIAELEGSDQLPSVQNDSFTKLKMEEKFMYDLLPDLIHNSPEKFRFSMYETCRELEGPFGTERIKVLKNSFNRIIENVLPMNFKAVLSGFTYVGFWRMLTVFRDITRNKRSSYKFYRASLGTSSGDDKSSENSSSKEDLKKIKIREKIIETYYKYPYSERVIDCWARIGDETQGILFEIRKSVQELVKIRNKLLCQLENLHNHFFDSGMYADFTSCDVASCHSIAKTMKGADVFNPFTLFQLNKKEDEECTYDDDQLSWLDLN